MYHVEQMKAEPTRQAQLRRLQDTLAVVGAGVIAFGTWTLVKIALLFALYNEEAVLQLLHFNSGSQLPAIFITAIFVACFDLFVRVFVGLSARAEGHGEKKGDFYLIIAGFIAVANVLSIASLAFGSTVNMSPFDAAVSIAIDATSFITLVLMVRCAVRLRQLNKQTG